MDDTTATAAPGTIGAMPGKIDKGRDARLELRLTPEEKRLVEEAARLGGEDVSTFVRRVALLEARALLARMGPPR